MAARLDALTDVGRKAGALEADAWRNKYADGLTESMVRLRAAGATDKMPEKLVQKARDVIVKDENGKPWDELRGPNSKVQKLSDAMGEAGTDYRIISRWMGGQSGSSWSNESVAVKYLFYKQRDLPFEDYFWNGRSEDAVRAIYEAAAKAVGGEEKFVRAWQYQHAFTQELLAKTKMRFNDLEKRTLRLTRTEAETVAKELAANPGRQVIRGAHESASLFRLVAVGGNRITTQEVPHERITVSYLQERKPGSNTCALLSDRENEFLFIPQHVSSTLYPRGEEPSYGK